MGLNQRTFRNWRFATLVAIKAVANANNQTLCYCDETETLYRYDSTSGATADDKYILITGAGGATRWIGVGGQYQTSFTALPNETQLGEVAILLDAALSCDEKWSGIADVGIAGAALVVGKPCYLASSGKWLPVDGILDGTDVGFKAQLGICILAAAGDTDPTKMLLWGKVRSAAFPVFTPGAPVYLGDPAGTLVVAQPSTSNFAIRIVGYAITAEDLLFAPSPDYIVIV